MCAVSINTRETGVGITSIIQQELEHESVPHTEEESPWEVGWVCWHTGIHICTILQQQRGHLYISLPHSHQKRVEGIQIRVSTSLQQCGGCVYVAAAYQEVECGAATVLIHLGVVGRQLGIDVKACLNENLQDVLSVTLCCKVEWTYTNASHNGFVGAWKQ